MQAPTMCYKLFRLFNYSNYSGFTIFYITRQVHKEQILIYNDGLQRPNPDDVGPIVRRHVGLPITAGCDTAWIRTRVSVVDASSTEMQCLRPLRHSGAKVRGGNYIWEQGKDSRDGRMFGIPFPL